MLRTRIRVRPTTGLVLATICAVLLTALAVFELHVPALAPAYGKPAPLTLRVPHGARVVKKDAQVVDVRYEYRRLVIPRGTVLNPGNEKHRSAMNHEDQRRPPRVSRLAATFVLYLFVCLVLTNYFQRFGHSRMRLVRSQVGLFALMLLVVAIAKAVLLFTTLPPFWMPVSALALWVCVGFDRRTALLIEIAAAFVVCSLVRFDQVLLAVLVMRGITSTLFFFNKKYPRQMFLAGLLSGVAAMAGYVALRVLLDGAYSVGDDVAAGWGSNLVACFGGGILAGIVGNLLTAPAQFAMGHVSRERLLDLTDIEAPLLKKMAAEAPGSWEHSRAMANLAEAAAASIGADSLLTRVGAYYHDLGKTVQCKYFIENLGAGETSPHNELEPEVSADAIMAHVVLGTKILRDGGVPEPVVEFCYTHHGTQRVEYFWRKYRDNYPDEETRELGAEHFTYPGMKPMTKETAILMLVDSIEAASRTIQPPEHDAFEEMIRRVVFTKLKAGQLDDSGLTLTELRIMTQRMAATLVNMYHGRIKYPWQRKKEREEALKAAKAELEAAAAADADADDDEAGDDTENPSTARASSPDIELAVSDEDA